MTTTVADLVGGALSSRGARHAFGLVGSGNFDLSNALVTSGMTFTAARHETGAVMMADAYAKVSGQVGVVTLHQGCGLTNAVTGIAEAAKSRTPMVVLAADTAAASVNSNFRIDQEALVRSVGAVSERVHGATSAAEDIRRAWHRAVAGRSTVVLHLPTDVQALTVPDPTPLPLPCSPLPVRPSAEAVSAVADLLDRAERPLLLAGRGAQGHRDMLERLGDLTGAVLTTTAVCRGLFAGSEWSVDVCGGLASPTAARLIASADVVVAFGAALTMWTTKHGALVDGAAVVQIDDDVTALGRHQSVALPVLADVGEAAAALVAEIEDRGTGNGGRRTPELAHQIAEGSWSAEPFDDVSSADAIDPRAFSLVLDRALPPARTVVLDSGHFLGWPSRYLSVPDERGFVFSQSFQCVGLGLSSAIGAAIARPDRLAVAALGDGGALMGLAELETVGRLGLHIAVVVYNDQAYGAEAHHFGPAGKALDLVRFPDTDFAALGRAVGLEAVTIRRAQDVQQVVAWVNSGSRSGIVIDVKVVPTLVADWLEDAFVRH
ncbi:thiamine pyrophosphate-binding protein [Modestobacter lapidis]|nr:thiamine pyrophosphate-binding protein [Modestobacter lapidis]